MMKKLAYSKEIKKETIEFRQTLIDNTSKLYEEYMGTIDTYCSKLNKEYSKNIQKLIENIAIGENLDVKMLKEKYMINEPNITKEQTFEDDSILNKIIINEVEYYYENKEDGTVYNKSSIVVGKYQNSKFIFT